MHINVTIIMEKSKYIAFDNFAGYTPWCFTLAEMDLSLPLSHVYSSFTSQLIFFPFKFQKHHQFLF